MYHGFVHQTGRETRGNLLGLFLLIGTFVANRTLGAEQSMWLFGGCLAVVFPAWLLLERRLARLPRN